MRRGFVIQRALEVSELVSQDDVFLLQSHGHLLHLFLGFSGLVDLEFQNKRKNKEREWF